MLVIVALIACGPSDDAGTPTDSALPPLEPALELGTGEDVFTPIADGDEINVVRGPQGGYHVYGSLRAQGIEAGDREDLQSDRNPVTTFEVLQDGVQIDLGAIYQQGLDATDDPRVFEMVGRLLILDIADDDDLEGEEIVVTVNVTDADGVSLDDRRTLVAVKDPRND